MAEPVGGGLFALHPLRVESVAWVSERKDVLSGFFGLLALMAYARYAQGRSQNAEVQNAEVRGDTRPQHGSGHGSRFTFTVTAHSSISFPSSSSPSA